MYGLSKTNTQCYELFLIKTKEVAYYSLYKSVVVTFDAEVLKQLKTIPFN